MFKNYLKIAWRHLIKNKTFSFLNIAGLSIGMAVAMLIGLWVWDELSFNHYHKNHKQVAQVMVTQTFKGEVGGTGEVHGFALGEELRSKYGQDFKHVAMAIFPSPFALKTGNRQITQQGQWVEADFSSIFSLQMKDGSIKSLDNPSSVLISASLAKALFGRQNPLSKAIKVQNYYDFKIAGVYQDLPKNTSLYGTEILLPLNRYITILNAEQKGWKLNAFQCFVELNDQADMAKTSAKIKDIAMPHLGLPKGDKSELLLQPMDNWHLYSEFEQGKISGGRIKFVWLFGTIGIFVLILACINFINLSTARSEKRVKEVGIRKVAGSLRIQLIGQFLTESFVLVLCAFILSLVLVQLSLPFFNELAGKQITRFWLNSLFWVLSIGFLIITGLTSGSYPAFYLSGFKPAKVLKGSLGVGKYTSLPRKVLVVIQFTVSIALIIGTTIVFSQVQHAKERPKGYNSEGLITVRMNTPELHKHYEAIRLDLLNTGAVQSISKSSGTTTDIKESSGDFDWEDKDPAILPLFSRMGVTPDFGKTVSWKIKQGRDFSSEFLTDSNSVILNEAAVKLTGIKQILGKTIRYRKKPFTVVGVVKDMVTGSPYEPISPTIFSIDSARVFNMTIRLAGMPVTDAVQKISAVFKRYNPTSNFDYTFTDDDYADKFTSEERTGKLAGVFAGFAILISCLGLFGLASFVAEQRIKEVGIRKVLGASVTHITTLLSKDFLVLVLIAILIASPIAYITMQKWLQDFAYRVQISWWMFAAAGCAALAIALFTVSFQAVKAALANPVKSLRSE